MELRREEKGVTIADIDNEKYVLIYRKLKPSKILEQIYINSKKDCYVLFSIGEVEFAKIKLGKFLNKDNLLKRINYLLEKNLKDYLNIVITFFIRWKNKYLINI